MNRAVYTKKVQFIHEMLPDIVREISILQYMQDIPFIGQLVAVRHDIYHVYLDLIAYNMDFDLFRLRSPSTDDVVTVMFQVLLGYRNLQSMGIQHRDISPGNILIGTADCRLATVISDFGLSSPIYCGTRQWCGQQVLAYRAPEFWFHKQECEYTEASEVWTIGILFLEALTHIAVINTSETIRYIDTLIEPDEILKFLTTTISTLLARVIDPPLRNLIEYMLDMDP